MLLFSSFLEPFHQLTTELSMSTGQSGLTVRLIWMEGKQQSGVSFRIWYPWWHEMKMTWKRPCSFLDVLLLLSLAHTVLLSVLFANVRNDSASSQWSKFSAANEELSQLRWAEQTVCLWWTQSNLSDLLHSAAEEPCGTSFYLGGKREVWTWFVMHDRSRAATHAGGEI